MIGVRILMTSRWVTLTALLILVVIGCVSMGAWQWSRAHRAVQPVSQSDGGAQELGQIYQPGDALPQAAYGAPVEISGKYDEANQLLVPDRLQDGASGYWILTPLNVEGGGVVPIVRGWSADATASNIAPPSGQVKVLGQLEPSETDDATSGALLPHGQIDMVSSAQLVSLWPGELYLGFVILQQQDPSNALATIPIPPAQSATTISWQNFAYAIQWWLFALFACFFWWRVLQADLADERARGEGHDVLSQSSPRPPTEFSEARE